jgi:hypothetical protein
MASERNPIRDTFENARNISYANCLTQSNSAARLLPLRPSFHA